MLIANAMEHLMFKHLTSIVSRLRHHVETEGADATFPQVVGPLDQHEIRERLQQLIGNEQLDQFTRLWAQHWLKAF